MKWRLAIRIIAFSYALGGAVLLSYFMDQVAHAQTPTPTPSLDVSMNRAEANRNIIDDSSGGDLVFTVRYELPQSDADGVSDAWCLFLFDQDGCDGTPAAPTNPTSLPTSTAFLRLRDTGSPTLLHASPSLQRIGHGLAVLYIGIGHGITWDDNDIEMCIESTGTPLFVATSTSCAPVTWSGEASTMAEQRTDFGANIAGILRELEQERSESFGTFVSNAGLITQAGQTFTKEQTIPIEQIVPGAFQSGAAGIGSDYATPEPDSNLSNALATAVATTTVGQAMEGASQEFFGMPAATTGTYAMFIGGLIVASIVFGITKDSSAAALAFFSAPIVGVAFEAPHIHVLLTTLFLLAVLAIIAFFSRVNA